jgi:hypothetical protein
VEGLTTRLKEQIIQVKDRKIDHLQEMVAQKEAKIKLFDSRIKILQKYVIQKKSDI